MRILVDIQSVQCASRDRGIGHYSLALTKAMIRNANGNQIFVLLSDAFSETIAAAKAELSDILPESHIYVISVPTPCNENSLENAWRVRAAELVREQAINELSPDAVLITSLFEGYADNAVSSVGKLYSHVPTAAILYDLIPFISQEIHLSSPVFRDWYLGKIESLKRTDLLLAISESAANEARHALGVADQRVVNIVSAVSDSFRKSEHADQADVLKALGINRKFLMHVGVLEPRKNFDGVIKAFAALPKSLRNDYQLVLVFKLDTEGVTKRKFLALADSLGLGTGELILTGRVSDEQLITLYSNCHLFVYPSLHEGFGLPALEAMSCGTPVVGSNTSSIPEVVGLEDALFDPHSIDSMRDVIQRALTDEAFWSSLKLHAETHSKNFSWDKTAQLAIKALESLHEQAPITVSELDSEKSLFEIAEKIAKIGNPTPTKAQALAEVSESVYQNRLASDVIRANADFGEKLIWRVEGPFDSTYSLALLNREVARAMSELGHQVILHSTEGEHLDLPVNESFLQRNPELAQMNARVPDYPHSNVNVASRNLYPPRVWDMHSPLNLLQHYNWEESGFPHEWVDNFNTHLDGIICTSRHVEKIMIDNGVSVPLSVSGCGVDHWERIIPSPHFKLEGTKGFRFLHVSTCLPRKGPEALLDAYGIGFTIDDDVTLVVKTSPNEHNKIHDWIATRKAKNQLYPHVLVIEDDLSDEDIKALYTQCHALVQPTRAEGFGLPQAEAMLSGIPVITTAWSGQIDFCTAETAWLVDYKFSAAKTHFGLYSSSWADIDVEALAKAMLEARQSSPEKRKHMAEAGRQLLMREFTWTGSTARSINAAQVWRANKSQAPVPKIGWITTWNTRCGIATYSEHLVDQMPNPENITIFASPQNEPHENDQANCFRSWQAGFDSGVNNFGNLSRLIQEQELNTLVIQFNAGLFHFLELTHFIEEQVAQGIVVIITLHSTMMGPAHVELYAAFRKCHRILVHSVHDLNRLKDYGVVENVCLFPHGVLGAEHLTLKLDTKPADQLPMVAAYGFCLPHKGLKELVQAIALLKQQGFPVRLRLVNAEYPVLDSKNLVRELRMLVSSLQISELVEFYNDFLEDEESLKLLVDADMLVFPYQETGESASGAVRYGMATKKPVGVTPLSIFDDLGNAVFHFSGTSFGAIAEGIRKTLHEIKEGTANAERIQKAADSWRAQHNYKNISQRLHHICVALLRKNERKIKSYAASSRELKVGVGRVEGRSVVSTHTEGYLLYGPYCHLPAGRYEVVIYGKVNQLGAPAAFADIVVQYGMQLLAVQTLKTDAYDGVIARMMVYLKDPIGNLEIRMSVSQSSDVVVDKIEIVPLLGALYASEIPTHGIRIDGTQLESAIAHRDGLTMKTSGIGGFFYHGAYMNLTAGDYRIKLYGKLRDKGTPSAFIEAVSGYGRSILLAEDLVVNPNQDEEGNVIVDTRLNLEHDVYGFETRVWVPDDADLEVSMVEIMPVQPPKVYSYFGSDAKFGTIVGRRTWLSMESKGHEGHLLFGPYLNLEKGSYSVELQGIVKHVGTREAYAEVAINRGSCVIASTSLVLALEEGSIAFMQMNLDEAVNDFEVRVWVDHDAYVNISRLEIKEVLLG